MWKNRIRPGNPEKLGVTRAGRELNFAVAVQDGKDCSLLLYRKGMDEPELELGFTDDMRFGEICAMGLEGLPEPLRQMAYVRLENPQASLGELGKLLDPPVGKSGVNHRLRKLGELAKELKVK